MSEERLSNQTLGQIKKEARLTLVKWSIGGGVALFSFAISGWWLYLEPRLVKIAGGVPSGAVVAFDTTSGCPSGWHDFELAHGRTIVGAGENFEFRTRAGSETHVLTIDEMPPHSHEINDAVVLGRGVGGDGGSWRTGFGQNDSEPKGGGKPHNNMPPYIVLHWCKKV